MKKIYKYWTVQSSNLEDFDNEINADLDIGWKILDNGYNIIQENDKNIYSQVLFWEDDVNEDIHLLFYLNDTMKVKRMYHNKENGEKEYITWAKRKGFGSQYIKHYEVLYPEGKRKLIKLENEEGIIEKLVQYKKDYILTGEYIQGCLIGNFDNILTGHKFHNYEEGFEFTYTEPLWNYNCVGFLTYREFFSKNITENEIKLNVSKSSPGTIPTAAEASSLENFLKINKDDEIGLFYFSRLNNPNHPDNYYYDKNIPKYYFRGIILLNEQREWDPYYVKQGIFIEFSKNTGKRVSELEIVEGNSEYIISGEYFEYDEDSSDEMGRYSITNGKMK